MIKKIDFEFWDSMKAQPDRMDSAAINEAFHSDKLTSKQKLDLAELIIAGRMRVSDNERAETLNKAVGIFNNSFALEEFFYTEFTQVFCTWRYNYRTYVHALPLTYAYEAIRQVYTRLGVEIDDDEVIKIYNSDNLYSSFFELLAEQMKDNRYIVTEDNSSWGSFVFASYFNMWHIFGPLGFNGYSPYVVCADIGVLSPPASSWKYAAFTEEELAVIDELRIRCRGRKWPAWSQNRFMGKLGKL